MIVTYELLDDVGKMGVARERVLELEREHFRLRLLLAEAQALGADVNPLMARVAEVEQRHAVHTSEPATDATDGDGKTEPELPAEDGADKTEPELSTTSRNGAGPH